MAPGPSKWSQQTSLEGKTPCSGSQDHTGTEAGAQMTKAVMCRAMLRGDPPQASTGRGEGPRVFWRPSCHRKGWEGHCEAPWSGHSRKNQQDVYTSRRFHPRVVPPAPKTHPYTPVHLELGQQQRMQRSTRIGMGGGLGRRACQVTRTCVIHHFSTHDSQDSSRCGIKPGMATRPPRWTPSAHLLRARPAQGASRIQGQAPSTDTQPGLDSDGWSPGSKD